MKNNYRSFDRNNGNGNKSIFTMLKICSIIIAIM